MKYPKILLIFVYLSSMSVYNAQTTWCGTDQSDSFMKDLRENKKSFEAIRNKSRVDRFIPVTFHSVANTNGTSRMKDINIYKALHELNVGFHESEMRFYLKEINYIDDSSINENEGNQSIHKDPNSINVFIQSDAGGAAGYYSRVRDAVTMTKSALNNGNRTLQHELGHFFTLAHTHRGWDETSGESNSYNPADYGDTIMITHVTSGQSGRTLIELMDGSNCDLASDGICDTPPDYGFGSSASCGCCTMIYDVWDLNGDKVIPMMDNAMSYSADCDKDLFTEGQTIAMFTDYDSNRRDFLRTNNSVNTYTLLEDLAELISPVDPFVEQYDGVLFDWEDVPNAEGYIVTIEGDLTANIEVTESELFVQDLIPNGTYFWFVNPFNKFGAPNDAEEVRIFSTGTGTTSLNEIGSLTDYSISPNPIATGYNTNLFLTSELLMDATVTIIDINGRKSLSQNETLQAGTNKIVIETSLLTAGIYILQVETETGKITDKLLIK